MKSLEQATILRNPRIVSLVLVAGLVLSLAGALVTRASAVRHAQAQVEAEATIAQEDLLYTLQAYRDLLLGFRAHSAASIALSRERFRQYFQALDLKTHHPGLLAVSYGLDIPGSERDALEAELRRGTRDPGLTIHPPGQRERHFVIVFAEPPENNVGAVGMDTRAVPGNTETIELARDSGALVVTGPFRVIQYQGPDPGLVMRLPLYRGPAATVAERQREFVGCITGVFRIQDLIQECLGKQILRRLEVRVEDLGLAGRPGEPPRAMYGRPLEAGGYRVTRTVEVGGRVWRLSFRARTGWLGYQDRVVPLTVGLGGCLMTLLLWGLILSLSQTGQRARLLALRMTEQLREEQSRTEAMALAVPDPLAMLDEDGRFLHIYGRRDHVLGTTADALEGRNVRQTLPAAAAETLMAGVHRAADSGRLQTALFQLDTQEGRRDLEGRLLTMAGPVEGKRCVVLSIRDITERNRAEEVTRTRQKLESLGVLAGGIAHDFNNFLTAILGHINLAQDRIDDPTVVAPNLKRAEVSVLRAAELAHQMLAYSGRGSLKVDHLDLNRVVEEMTELLSVSISKKAALEFQLEPGLPPIIADAVQIQQVVMNLVTNASEALGDGPGSIRIETRGQRLEQAVLDAQYPGQALQPGPYVELRVADTGCGMDAETRKRIFDPFFTTKATGRGLGLSALLGILKGHGAGIRIDSAPRRGSVFELLFPAAEWPHARARAAHEAGAAEPDMAGLALVADDEPMVRSVLSGLLENRGLRVLEAADGQEAVDLFKAHQDGIDLVLLDITMPRLDGNEAFRAIRALAPEVPVILLSGFTSLDVAKPPAGTAPALFVQKPFRAADLEEALRRAIG